MTPPADATAALRRPVALAMLAAVVTIVLKAAAYGVTGSVGLFSDALESGVNLLAAGTAFLSLRYAGRPADRSHTYGHEKIEFFSSGLEGALVALAGVGTVLYAARQLAVPAPLADLSLGGGIGLVAAAVNAATARALLRAARRHDSPVLDAAGHHLLADVWTSLGVIAGLALVHVTAVPRLDGAVAVVVGGMIARTGFRLVRQAFHGLMDHALPAAEQDAIRAAIRAALPPGAAFHVLRTRRAGRRRLADFHLLVAGHRTVRDAHALAHAVEDQVKLTVPDLDLTIHVEPIEDAESWERDTLARLGEAPADAAGGRP